jgi:hypothetical protein
VFHLGCGWGADSVFSRMTSATKFEQEISRIHELLEGDDAEVTWNDRIIDPDNPERLRQIDITVKKQRRLTIVECRIHKNPQDVKWIEEMIGRRESLRADNAIAVSAAGFTKGARLKAAKHEIILRELQSLTDVEILAWGRTVELTLLFYQYSNLEITFFVEPANLELVDPIRLNQEFGSSPIVVSAFNAVAKRWLHSRGVWFAVTSTGRVSDVTSFIIDLRPFGPMVVPRLCDFGRFHWCKSSFQTGVRRR